MEALRGFLYGLIMPGVYFLVLLGVGMVLYWTVHVLLRGFGGRGMTSLVLMFSVVGAVLLGGGKSTGTRGGHAPAHSPIMHEDMADDAPQLTQAAFRVSDIQLTNGTFQLTLVWTNGLFAVGTRLDCLVKTNLNDVAWRWCGLETVEAGTTNITHSIPLGTAGGMQVGTDGLVFQTPPTALFVRVVPRLPVSDLRDSDGDGAPDIYEFHNGTNPWVKDYELIPKIFADERVTLRDALARSEPWNVVEIAPGYYSGTGWSELEMPPYPVLVSSGTGPAVIDDAAGFAVFLLPSNTTEQTVFRNLYLDRSGTGLQVGFWCGGNLPWARRSASATFENVHVRFSNPQSSCYGWIFYGSSANRAIISNCVVDAQGATNVRGIYAVDPPPLVVDHSTFANFPVQTDMKAGAALMLEALAEVNATNECPVSIRNCVFDESFSNACVLVRKGSPSNSCVTIENSLLPRSLDPAREPVVASGALWIAGAGLVAGGFPVEGSVVATQGIGALSVLEQDSARDTDSDGLSDWDEVYHYNTDPILPDTDRDGFPDGLEVSENTSPTDSRSYCYDLTVVVTNDIPDEPLIRGALFASAETNAPCSQVFCLTNSQQSVPLGHQTVIEDCRPVFRVWRDNDTNGVWDVREYGKCFTHVAKCHDVTNHLSLTSAFMDPDRDGIPEYWWIEKSVTNGADQVATADSDGDGMINLHEYWAGTHPLQPDGSNTAFSVFSRSVDDRICGVTSNMLDRFNNYIENGYNGVFIANTNFWLRNVDFSCVSVWQNGLNNQTVKCATAITRRHVILSGHWHGYDYTFCDTNGVLIQSSLAPQRAIINEDLMLARLTADLPETVRLPKLLPPEFQRELISGKYLPGLCVNQFGRLTLLEVADLNCSTTNKDNNHLCERYGRVAPTNLVGNSRSHLRSMTADGFSASPVFLLAGNELVYLFSKHLGYRDKGDTWLPAWGPMVSLHLSEIEEHIRNWEGSDARRYQLDVINLGNLTWNGYLTQTQTMED